MTKKNKKKWAFLRPRGTRDIVGNDFYKYQGFFEKASDTAHYYGFKPIHTPLFEKEEVFTSSVGRATDIVEKEMYTLRIRRGEKLALRPEGTAGVMRAYIEGGMHTFSQPVLLYYYGPFFRHDKPQRGRHREFFQFGLEALGTSKSVMDAMIIQITHTILKEAGFANLCVLINSIGDSVCRPNYIKELATYYRGHINTLCPHCRQRLKTNPMRLLDCKDERCRQFKEEAPEILAYLCDKCKQHFKEVLEHLDILEIPYKIDHALVRGIDYYTKTVFEIINDEDGCARKEKITKKNQCGKKEDKKKDEQEKEGDVPLPPPPLALASGGRYDNLAEQLKSKVEVPAVGVSIGVDRVLASEYAKELTPRILKKPKIFFIQIGFEAKLKSLAVIDVLRMEKIPVAHSLSKDKLSSQLAMAEKSKIQHVIIMGQKEALGNTVIVRNMVTRSQSTIKIEKLGEYLKKKL